MMKNGYLELIGKWTGTIEDLCYEIYRLLSTEQDKGMALRDLCENFNYAEPKDAKHVFFSLEEIDTFKKIYGKLVDESIKSVIQSIYLHDKSLDDAYGLLWNTVFETQLLSTNKEKAFALFWIIVDNIIPYRPLNKAVRMESEQFKGVCEKLSDSIMQIQYIIDFPFEQRTETASLLLDEILKSDENDDRIVLMAQALARHTEKYTERLRKELSKKQTND